MSDEIDVKLDNRDGAPGPQLVPVDSAEQSQELEAIVVKRPTIKCSRCGLEKERSKTDEHLCEQCVSVEMTTVSKNPLKAAGWMNLCAEAGLELFERQPQETDKEWVIWCDYRDCYPVCTPTYKYVALKRNIPVGLVKRVADMWSYTTRMQAWASHCDRLTMQTRQAEIVEMNKKHVKMASDLNEKIAQAIIQLDTYGITPSALNSLLKTATELERKARLDTKADEREAAQLTSGVTVSDNSAQQGPKREDMDEIVGILMKAGVIGAPGSKVGVRKTTTTEIISSDDGKL